MTRAFKADYYNGSQVGGFVGLVGAMQNGNPRPGKLTITNSAFYGAIEATEAKSATKFGGFVGENCADSTGTTIDVSNIIVCGYMSCSADCGANNNGLVLGWLNSGADFTLENAVGQVKKIDDDHKILTGTNTIGTKPVGDKLEGRTCEIIDAFVGPNMFSGSVTSLTFSNQDGDRSFDLSETFELVNSYKPVPKGLDPADVFAGYVEIPDVEEPEEDWDADAEVLTVGSASDLIAFVQAIVDGNDFSGKTITITADIDVTGETWPTSGKQGSVFSGMIDGQNHTLTGIVLNGGGTYQAIFGAYLVPVEGFVTGVKNLTIEDSSVNGTQLAGGLFGQINNKNGDVAGEVLFDNLDLDIKVTGSGTYTGTIAGTSRADKMTISNCVIRGSVSGTTIVGGMIGWQMDKELTVTNSVVTAEGRTSLWR